MAKSERFSALTEGLSLLLLLAALIGIQVLIGGTRMVFSLPAYLLVGGAGVLGLFSLRREKPAASQVCLIVTALFFSYILGRALLSPVPYIARSDIYSVLGALVVYFLVSCVLTDPRQRVWLFVVLLFFSLAHVLVGAVQFRDGLNFMPISWLQRYDYEWRASGFFVCPNHLAGLLEVLGVIGLSIVCWSRWPVWGKLLVAYVVGICYVGLVLTASRGGYLSAGTSLFVFGVLSLATLRHAGGRLIWTVGGAGAVIAVLLAVGTVFYVGKSPFLKDRAGNTFETTNIRIDMWQAALKQWATAPVLGTGSATYLYGGRTFRTERMQMDPIYVHNDYLQLLAEYGVIGMLGMAVLIGVHLRHGATNFMRLGPKRVATSQRPLSNALALNIGALAAVASFMVHSVFDFNLHIPGNVLVMACVFGLVANGGVARDRESAAGVVGPTFWRLLLVALALLLIVAAARLLPGEYYSERARMAVRDNQPGLALLFAQRGLGYDPRNPDLYHHLGSAHVRFADLADIPEAKASFEKEAIAAFEKARALAPREQVYGLELAAVLSSAGRNGDAARVYEALISDDPRSESLRRYQAAHARSRDEGRAPAPVDTPPIP